MSSGIFKFVQINMKHLLYKDGIKTVGDQTCVPVIFMPSETQSWNYQAENRAPK